MCVAMRCFQAIIAGRTLFAVIHSRPLPLFYYCEHYYYYCCCCDEYNYSLLSRLAVPTGPWVGPMPGTGGSV